MRLGVAAENLKITANCFADELKAVGVDEKEVRRADLILRDVMDRLEQALGVLSFPQEGGYRDKFPHLLRSWTDPPESKEPAK